MSGIAAIDPIALDSTPLPSATIPPPDAPTDQPQATGDNADEPAVIISLSSEANAPTRGGPTTLSLDPDEVDYALSWAVGVNGFTANAARSTKANVAANGAGWNEADVAADYGTAIADRGSVEVIGAAVGSPSEALYHAANLGIPILDSVSSDAVKSGTARRVISVGAFTFTNGGSTYAVTHGADDRLIGTKDGQEWKTWQVTGAADVLEAGPRAADTLHPVTSLTAEPTAPANETHVNVSA
jgi:hypothetical protein